MYTMVELPFGFHVKGTKSWLKQTLPNLVDFLFLPLVSSGAPKMFNLGDGLNRKRKDIFL